MKKLITHLLAAPLLLVGCKAEDYTSDAGASGGNHDDLGGVKAAHGWSVSNCTQTETFIPDSNYGIVGGQDGDAPVCGPLGCGTTVYGTNCSVACNGTGDACAGVEPGTCTIDEWERHGVPQDRSIIDGLNYPTDHYDFRLSCHEPNKGETHLDISKLIDTRSGPTLTGTLVESIAAPTDFIQAYFLYLISHEELWKLKHLRIVPLDRDVSEVTCNSGYTSFNRNTAGAAGDLYANYHNNSGVNTARVAPQDFGTQGAYVVNTYQEPTTCTGSQTQQVGWFDVQAKQTRRRSCSAQDSSIMTNNLWRQFGICAANATSPGVPYGYFERECNAALQAGAYPSTAGDKPVSGNATCTTDAQCNGSGAYANRTGQIWFCNSAGLAGGTVALDVNTLVTVPAVGTTAGNAAKNKCFRRGGTFSQVDIAEGGITVTNDVMTVTTAVANNFVAGDTVYINDTGTADYDGHNFTVATVSAETNSFTASYAGTHPQAGLGSVHSLKIDQKAGPGGCASTTFRWTTTTDINGNHATVETIDVDPGDGHPDTFVYAGGCL